MGSQRYIRGSELEGLDRLADKLGRDVTPILKRHGLSRRVFQVRDTELSFDAVCHVLEDCAQEWKCADLGVQLSRYHSLNTVGIAALSARMVDTVRLGTLAVIRNQFLYSDTAIYALQERGALAEISLSIDAQGVPLRQFIESSLCGVAQVLNCLAGRRPEVAWTSVVHAEPTGRDALSLELGGVVSYRESHNAISFRADILDLPCQVRDPTLDTVLGAYFAEARARNAANLSELVRLEVVRQVTRGNCSLESVAHALVMEPRTLQRRLHNERASFREIHDQERRRRALLLVQETRMPMSEVAISLGYADQTAFNQAFRRWFGRSPMKVRRGPDERAAA